MLRAAGGVRIDWVGHALTFPTIPLQSVQQQMRLPIRTSCEHTNDPSLWGPDHWHPRAYKTQTLRARRRCIVSDFPLASTESGSTYGFGQPGTQISRLGLF